MTGRAPSRPVPAVIAVVLRGDHVLLVRRANPPDAGLWGFPGGKIEYGETVADAALRELQEETAIAAQAGEVLATLDILDRDEGGHLRHHYILIAVRCILVSGEPLAGDDALEVRWFPVCQLDPARLPMSADVDTIARLALQASPA
ncbi:NUDIX hydrolase [Microvirga sp. 17 mud 1-3]|uniref:NUDIX hydrolase n=1 Tax=Microvirga sp. 17 mud 1-3 TaxID=2082949 RepID=UPI001AEC7CE9|nr:NUDIX hydrolase [Microvirga sp. 17 mud 1-3]